MILSDRKHLVSTVSLDELHNFAECIGLKREWFRDCPKPPHYELTKRMALKAWGAGATVVSSKELAQRAWEEGEG
jgi:hypothetical protein